MSQLKCWTGIWLTMACVATMSTALSAQTRRTEAQRLVEAVMSRHSEISGLELSSTPPGKHTCMTIAATEAKDLGERCDEDEFRALATRKPFVEQEQDGFDVTSPLHDVKGKLIGTVGIDFKPRSHQTKADILRRTAEIVWELEQQISSRAFLFQPAP